MNQTKLLTCVLLLSTALTVSAQQQSKGQADGKASVNWVDLYEPHVDDEMPYRLMKPMGFDSSKRYPVIISLHGGGGRGRTTGNSCAVGTNFLPRSRGDPVTPAMCSPPRQAVCGMPRTSRTSKMSLRHCRPLIWTGSISSGIQWEGMGRLSSYKLIPVISRRPRLRPGLGRAEEVDAPARSPVRIRTRRSPPRR